MEDVKVVDGFIFLLVTDKAKEIFSSGTFNIYVLHEDETESLVRSYSDIEYAKEKGLDIGIEVGFIKDIITKNK
jgi:hypothetical protein